MEQAPRDEPGPARATRPRGMDQGPARRIRTPRDESGPRETNQGPAGRIRAPRNESGPPVAVAEITAQALATGLASEHGWKTDRFLVPFRPGALFSVASYPVPASAPNPQSQRPPRTPGEMQT